MRAIRNPRVDALIAGQRAAAGVGGIPPGAGARVTFRLLRANHWVALLGDQDARSRGVFVPFFGQSDTAHAQPPLTGERADIGILHGRHARRPPVP